MGRIKLTTAQALVKFLNNQYLNVDGQEYKFIKGIMGIFGHGNVVGLGQALEEYKDEICYIQGKNEQEIAHACVAYAKQKRRFEMFACTASIGPGSLNMVTAAGTASVNRIPLLILPSDTYADRQPDPVLQQLEDERDHTVSVNDSFKAVSKYWDRITRPEQLMSACLNAMRVLTDPRQTGAVTICLPQDVQGESYEYPLNFLDKRVWYLDRTPATVDAVEKAAILIAESKKPLIIAGGGVRYSDAGAALAKFAEKFNIPFAETQAGKGEISFSNPYNLGCVGVCGTLCANLIAKEADLILAIGTRLNDFVTSSKSAFKSKDLQIVSINVNRMDGLKMDSFSIVADAREGLNSLYESLNARGYRSKYKDEIDNAKKQWLGELETFSQITKKEGLSQARVLMILNELFLDTDIVVSASGSLPSDLGRIWKPGKSGTYHLEYGFSCMGYEVSGALGVKLAEPSSEVYAFVGDGGFLMGHSDLVTSIQERRKINVLLFDNNGHQCIHNLQRSQGIDSFATEFRYREEQTDCLTGNYVPIDFAALARAYGAKAYTVTSPEELKEALLQSKKDTISTLIDIKVLPDTMTEGYKSFWRVGTASVSKSEKVNMAYGKLTEIVKTLRKY